MNKILVQSLLVIFLFNISVANTIDSLKTTPKICPEYIIKSDIHINMPYPSWYKSDYPSKWDNPGREFNYSYDRCSSISPTKLNKADPCKIGFLTLKKCLESGDFTTCDYHNYKIQDIILYAHGEGRSYSLDLNDSNIHLNFLDRALGKNHVTVYGQLQHNILSTKGIIFPYGNIHRIYIHLFLPALLKNCNQVSND